MYKKEIKKRKTRQLLEAFLYSRSHLALGRKERTAISYLYNGKCRKILLFRQET